MEEIMGIVTPGHRVASGACGDPRFPTGTIAPQLPFFERSVPAFLDHLGGPPYPGTINVRFPGKRVTVLQPEHHLIGIDWTTAFPAENFFLSRATLRHAEVEVPAYLYIPDPVTKPDHQQLGSVVEILCRRVPDLAYGDAVTLRYDPDAIAIRPDPTAPNDDQQL